jgi:CRP-like cAMP-binding protein
LVSLIGQNDDDSADTVQQSSESPIYLGTQAEKTATNTPEPDVHLEEDPSSETPDMPEPSNDDWTEPGEIIDLRPTVEPEAEMIRTHLHRCVAFSALSDSEFQELAGHVQLHELTGGSIIFDPNGTNRSLFVVFNGEVELSIKSETKDLARLHMVAGDFLGEHTFWKEHSMAVSANTSTACTLAEIPAATFLSFARKHPVMLQFLKRVCKRRYFAAMLAQSHVFQDCNMKDRQAIAEYLSPVHVSEGVSILPEGGCARDLYIIQSGEVNVFTTFVEEGESPIIQDAHEHVSLDHLREGDVFGEETFFTNEPCVTTFWARTDVLLLKLSGDCLSTFVELLPQFGGRLYELHQQRTQLTMQAVESVLAG